MNEIRGRLDARGRRFVIVASRFNEMVTERLAAGARACLLHHGAEAEDVHLVWVPGAWELPPVARRLADAGRHAAIIAVGCVIRGETPHFDFVAGQAAAGLASVAISAPVPVTFGVLTTDTTDQALARAGGKAGNKGWDAAMSALELMDVFAQLERGDEGT